MKGVFYFSIKILGICWHGVALLPNWEIVDRMNEQVESHITQIGWRHPDEKAVLIVISFRTHFDGFGAKGATYGRIFLSSSKLRNKNYMVTKKKLCFSVFFGVGGIDLHSANSF